MGNESSSDIQKKEEWEDIYSSSDESDESQNNNQENKERKKEPKSLQWRQSHHYVDNFTNKWLSKVSLRPIVVRNKLYGVNKMMEHQEIHKVISRFDDMMIHHSGIEIILNEDGDFGEPEVYVIFPNYPQMVLDLCDPEQTEESMNLKMEIAWILPEGDDMGMYEIFGTNYGFVNDVIFADKFNSEITDVPVIHVTKEGIYDKLLFENREFLARSILPVELLRIICDEYIGDTEDEGIRGLSILPPDINDTTYEWICHKIKDTDSKQETVTFHTGINLFGSYYTLTTEVHIDSHYDFSLREMKKLEYCEWFHSFGSQPRYQIIGRIY